MLELFLTICNQETAFELKRRWVRSQPVKHRTIISSSVRCVGKQYPELAQLVLKSQKQVQGVLPSFRFLSWLSSGFSQLSNAGWKELMAVSCHPFCLSKSQFGNSSEIISCTWWGTLCYPAASLGPCTWACALNKDLLLPCICQLFYRITLRCSTERHLFQQPAWLMCSQASDRRIGKYDAVSLCVEMPVGSFQLCLWQSQFSLPTYQVPVLKPAGADPLCTSTGNIFSWLDSSALLHSASHQHVFFTLSHVFGLTSLSPHKSLIHELLASLPTYFCVHLSRKCMKSMHLKEHCKQVKFYIPSEKS